MTRAPGLLLKANVREANQSWQSEHFTFGGERSFSQKSSFYRWKQTNIRGVISWRSHKPISDQSLQTTGLQEPRPKLGGMGRVLVLLKS